MSDKLEFEKLLSQAVALNNGMVGERVLRSGELVTPFTLGAERQTEAFTGIAINQEITRQELRISSNNGSGTVSPALRQQIRLLNRRAIQLLNGLIAFKEQILNNVLRCQMFTMNYPLLIEHILREARLYRDYVMSLERQGTLTDRSMQEVECFWNRIMMEHAMFIGGLLDPSEEELIRSADGLAGDYAQLLQTCRTAHDRTMTAAALQETVKFRDFKAAGAQGIQQCEIRSGILPLLADHVLREANHYIRLLEA